jgi:exodeoxyribonuclease-5
MSKYTLSQDQAAALKAIGVWYKSRSAPFLTLGGYAGTGKTTLIAYLRQALRDFDEDTSVAFCAYTGKATRVLQEKLREYKATMTGDSISTIHSLIYTSEESSGGIPKWVRKDRLTRDLIIVDEASMVDAAIWQDLLSFQIPVLAIGDHGQLPPINPGFNLMADPQLKLSRIFRQAEGSPIIEVATIARETGAIPCREFGPGVCKLDRSQSETGQAVSEMLENWKPELLVVCGYNATRLKLNHTIRSMRDMTSLTPQSGDQVVCLRNNRAKHIYNGMVGHIIGIRPADNDEIGLWYEADIAIDGEDYRYSGFVLKSQFGAMTTEREVPNAPDGERGDLWDFGYALTVHKAQGSQSASVLVFEERFGKSSDDDWRRWIYTAVTRAQERLTIIGPNYEVGRN